MRSQGRLKVFVVSLTKSWILEYGLRERATVLWRTTSECALLFVRTLGRSSLFMREWGGPCDILICVKLTGTIGCYFDSVKHTLLAPPVNLSSNIVLAYFYPTLQYKVISKHHHRHFQTSQYKSCTISLNHRIILTWDILNLLQQELLVVNFRSKVNELNISSCEKWIKIG